MYELIILTHLMRRPAHGYLIAKIINDIIGPYARVSNGRLYPLLAKLEQSGLITSCMALPGERHLRAYCITAAGKQRFHELMLNTMSNPGEYQKIFAQKVCYLDLLTLPERLRIIDHYINYCQAHILHQLAEAEDIIQKVPFDDAAWGDFQHDAVLDVIQHAADQWQLELAWAQKLRIKALAMDVPDRPTT